MKRLKENIMNKVEGLIETGKEDLVIYGYKFCISFFLALVPFIGAENILAGARKAVGIGAILVFMGLMIVAYLVICITDYINYSIAKVVEYRIGTFQQYSSKLAAIIIAVGYNTMGIFAVVSIFTLFIIKTTQTTYINDMVQPSIAGGIACMVFLLISIIIGLTYKFEFEKTKAFILACIKVITLVIAVVIMVCLRVTFMHGTFIDIRF